MNIPGLSNLGVVGKLLDPGVLVKDLVNGFLPKDMKVVGDVAGAVVDFKSGNMLGAAQLGMEAVKDLPQAAKALQGNAANAANGGGNAAKNPALDPPPPPLASQGGKPLDAGSLFAAIEKLTKLITELLAKKGGGAVDTTANKNDDASKAAGKGILGKAAESLKTEAAATKPADSPKAGATATPRSERHERTQAHDKATDARGYWYERAVEGKDTSVRTRSNARAQWKGEPRTAPPPAQGGARSTSTASAPPADAAKPAAAPKSEANSSAAPAKGETTTPAAPAKGDTITSSAPAKGETITSMDQIKGMSDSAIRDAVINGRISPELAKDQTAMMVLQQRMQAISEMNNLMTAMLRALHDMQMAVIQNIRI